MPKGAERPDKLMDLIKECEGAKKVGISGHVRPDGDAVCSCLALQRYLQNVFPHMTVHVNLQSPPETFAEVAGYDRIRTDFPDEKPYDVYFALDCNLDRLGPAQAYYLKAGKTVNIDHHVSNGGCGQVNEIQPQISSTAELLYSLMDPEYLDEEVAKALYIGMIHDTGVFQYSCTSPATMRRAADLLEYGFDFPRIIQESFYQKTYLQSLILGRCLLDSIRFMDGRCVVAAVNKRVQQFYGVTPKDFEGIVNQLRNIKGIDCAIFMYQTETQEYKVSLRTSEAVDAAKVAQYFGGGGHVRAAGCTMSGNFYDCVNNLSEQIELQLKETEESRK